MTEKDIKIPKDLHTPLKVLANSQEISLKTLTKLFVEFMLWLNAISSKAGIQPKDFFAFVKWLKENEGGSIQEFAQIFKKEYES